MDKENDHAREGGANFQSLEKSPAPVSNPWKKPDHRITERAQIVLRHLYISPAHNFFGHHGGPAGETPVDEVACLYCLKGQGIVGDRFFNYKDNYKGQITFFSSEIFARLCQHTGAKKCPPSAVRRNVLLEGIDINHLIDREFEIHGVRFVGTEECRPCHWMDEAVGPGAEDFLKGSGGLRARILSDGWLRRGRAELLVWNL